MKNCIPPEVARRPATYTELRVHAKSEGCGWFVSRFFAVLGVLGGTQVVKNPHAETSP